MDNMSGKKIHKQEIVEEFQKHKKDILEAISHEIQHWHTPIRGYTSMAELEADQRYQFLLHSEALIQEGIACPDRDITETDTGDIQFVAHARFYQYWILARKYIRKEEKHGIHESTGRSGLDRRRDSH